MEQREAGTAPGGPEGGKPETGERTHDEALVPGRQEEDQAAAPTPDVAANQEREGRKARELRKAAFLQKLREHRGVLLACEACEIGKTTVYEWRAEDERFKAAWDREVARTIELLEVSAYSRAIEGWDEPVFHQGEVVGTVKRFSNAMTIFMLKAKGPPEYRFEEHMMRESSLEHARAIREAVAAMRGTVPSQPPAA